MVPAYTTLETFKAFLCPLSRRARLNTVFALQLSTFLILQLPGIFDNSRRVRKLDACCTKPLPRDQLVNSVSKREKQGSFVDKPPIIPPSTDLLAESLEVFEVSFVEGITDDFNIQIVEFGGRETVAEETSLWDGIDK